MRLFAAWGGFAAVVLSPVPVFALVLTAGHGDHPQALAATVAGVVCYLAGVAALAWGRR